MADELVEALRHAGHGDLAEALEDKSIAERLRERGHTEIADQLDEKRGVSPPSREEAPAPTPDEQEAQVLQRGLQEMRERQPTVAVPVFTDDGKER